MIRAVGITLLVCLTAVAHEPTPRGEASASSPVAVARQFLPPNSQLAELYTFNYRTGRVQSQWPAVLQCHVVSPDSSDLVFAYYTPRVLRGVEKTLFIDLLHRTPRGYQKMYEISYRDQVLLIPRAIRIVHLPGVRTDAVAVVAGIGAALGGRLEVYLWSNLWGWQNIFPPNGSMDYFYLFSKPGGPFVALASALVKHRGLDVSPPPIWFRWNGKRFVKIPPPKGSAGWPLPD